MCVRVRVHDGRGLRCRAGGAAASEQDHDDACVGLCRRALRERGGGEQGDDVVVL